MPVFLKNGRAGLFIHVPKTGGTSIEDHFVNNNWQVSFRDETDGCGTLNSFQMSSPQHMEANRLSRLFRLERFDFIFMVVREPISRFRSEYLMRNENHALPDATVVEAWSDEAFSACAVDPFAFDNHLRPQNEFAVSLAVVYRFEDGIRSILDNLDLRYDLNLEGEIPERNAGATLRGDRSAEIPISPTLARRLRRYYSDDYKKFHY